MQLLGGGASLLNFQLDQMGHMLQSPLEAKSWSSAIPNLDTEDKT